MRRLAVALLAVSLGLLGPSPTGRAQSSLPADELFLVSKWNEDIFLEFEGEIASQPGCNSLSVFQLGKSSALLRFPNAQPKVRWLTLAAAHSLAVVLAGRQDELPGRWYASSLPRFVPASTDARQWTALAPLSGARFLSTHAPAVMGDGDTLLVGVVGPDDNKPQVGQGIAKYSLSEVGPDGRLGPLRGFLPYDVPMTLGMFDIIPSVDGIHAYVVNQDQIKFIDVPRMVEVAPPLPDDQVWRMPPRSESHNRPQFIPPATSPDECYMLMEYGSKRNGGRLVFAHDVLHRSGWWIELDRIQCVGDWIDPSRQPSRAGLCPLAFSYGPANRGLLAMRGGTQVIIPAFEPYKPLRQLGTFNVSWASRSAALGALAWSGDGSHVLVGELRPAGYGDVAAIRVSEGGRRLSLAGGFESCPERRGWNWPTWILTANRKLVAPQPVRCLPPTWTPAPPTESATPSPTATPSSTATLTPTSWPSATSRPSPTASPPASSTATRPRAPLHLPLALREDCPVMRTYADVALALDASTSMRDGLTSAGRPKLQAALEAAGGFLDLMSVPHDRAAVVVFNADAQLLQPLTGDRALLRAALGRIPGLVQRQTRIHRGLEVAHAELTGPNRRAANRPVLILLTDGLANPEPIGLALREAQEAKDHGITLFTIGLGTPEELNFEELRAMASRPEDFFHAPDGEQLLAIYRQIAAELPCPGARFWGQGTNESKCGGPRRQHSGACTLGVAGLTCRDRSTFALAPAVAAHAFLLVP